MGENIVRCLRIKLVWQALGECCKCLRTAGGAQGSPLQQTSCCHDLDWIEPHDTHTRHLTSREQRVITWALAFWLAPCIISPRLKLSIHALFLHVCEEWPEWSFRHRRSIVILFPFPFSPGLHGDQSEIWSQGELCKGDQSRATLSLSCQFYPMVMDIPISLFIETGM